ncbi:MAG: histidine kinase dimerization/phospho-acceptor domain-containing protein [Gaiellaceae bacterium]
MTNDRQYAELVSVACHDILTPLATVYGFARTLERVELEPPADRYVEMIGAASKQIDDLVDQLRLATRIQLGVYKPVLVEQDSLELAQAAAELLEEGRVEISGEGSAVLVDPDPTARALAQLARATARFGGHETVTMQVAGPVLTVAPLSRPAEAVVLGEEFRELAAPAAAMLVRALEGTLEARDETLVIVLAVSRSD